MSAAVGSRCCGSRLATTSAPSSASSMAMARPMPVPPPVTMATRSFRIPGRKITSTSSLFLHHHILSTAYDRPASRLGDDNSLPSFAAHISLTHLVWHTQLLSPPPVPLTRVGFFRHDTDPGALRPLP